MALGRPTAYDANYCEQIINHFDQPLYIDKVKEVASGGRAVRITEEKPNSMPTFEAFAGKIGVTHNTLRNWCKDYPDFFSAYSHCKDIQKKFIIEHGMMGNYNPGFAKFIAINVTDLKDVVTHDVVDRGIILNVTKPESEL